MKIDADSNGSVEWHEFMNYMLLENMTLSSMKKEHFDYIIPTDKHVREDPPWSQDTINGVPTKCHKDMITCIHIIEPDEKIKEKPDDDGISLEQYKKKMRYLTSSRDGTVKIWQAHDLRYIKTITVTRNQIWVTCITYMKKSDILVAGSANRMITFYDLSQTNVDKPFSRIEDLVGIPLCMEYIPWYGNNIKDGNVESLLVGDDLGICHLYNFQEKHLWHTCCYKLG